MNFKQLEDNKLLELMSAEENLAKQAFTEIYQRYSKKIYIYCKKVISDQNFADDIFQECFVKFYNSARTNNQISSLQSYLFRIARNLCLNFKRDNNQIYVAIEEFHVDYNLANPLNQIQNNELAELINQAMDLLIEEHREVFIMQAYQGLSYNEIAELLDVPITTVRNRIVRAKRKLKEVLAPYFESKRV
jgi:RNA polymerase sigma-70 factor (ECF subfamily)